MEIVVVMVILVQAIMNYKISKRPLSGLVKL